MNNISRASKSLPPSRGEVRWGGLSSAFRTRLAPTPQPSPARGEAAAEYRRLRFYAVAIALLLAALLSFTATDALAAWQTPTTPTQDLPQQQQPTPGVTATVSDPYYKILGADVTAAVATQLQQQGVVEKAEVTFNAGTPNVFYTADRPLQVSIHALQIDPSTKRWQAQVYILSGGQTELVKPIAGFYGAMIDVPVLTRQLTQHDIIEQTDITIRSFPERQLRKDTVTDSKDLLGKSPRNAISPDRAIRMTEIAMPIVIKRGDPVEMTYDTPYMHIKATGIALEDGAKGTLIRVKNDKSEKAVTTRVESAGHVQVNDASPI